MSVILASSVFIALINACVLGSGYDGERCELIQNTINNIINNHGKRQWNSASRTSWIGEREARAGKKKTKGSYDRSPPGVWEYLHEFRANPALWAQFQQNPASCLRVVGMMIDSFREYFNDPISDPMLVRKMILERQLNPNVLHGVPMKRLLEELSATTMFRRLFFDAPDLLAYIITSIAHKLPKENIDLTKSSISCTNPSVGLQGKGSLPWNLQLKDILMDIFPENKREKYFERTNQCIFECAIDTNYVDDISPADGSGASTVDDTFKYGHVSDQQVSFLNTVVEYPVILRVMLTDQQFVHTVLEQALYIELLEAVMESGNAATHSEIIKEMIRNPIVAKAIVGDPNSFVDAVNKLKQPQISRVVQ